MSRAWLLPWLCLGALSGCAPEAPEPAGQVLLYINTDAPLPAAPGALAPELTPLFDRLQLDIFPPGSDVTCDGCSREFAVDGEQFDPGRVSFGVVTTAAGTRVRVRLFRSGGTASGTSRPASTLEAVVALPWARGDGVRELNLSLLVKDLAVPQGTLDSPAEPLEGPSQPGLVGSWPGAQRAPCSQEMLASLGPEEACVPGGAFWMGDPRIDFSGSPEHDGASERLVVLSPFIVDSREVSVADFRASGLAIHRLGSAASDNPHERGAGIARCTYTSQPSDADQQAVNCLSWIQAQAYCGSLGKELPTEAQLEYLMSGLGGHSYVWGGSPPVCEDAVYGRGLGNDCSALGSDVEPAERGARDRLEIGDRVAYDLAGNVSEWAVDLFSPADSAEQAPADPPCWGAGIFYDPVCQRDADPEAARRSYRGGHFQSEAVGLRAAIRGFILNQRYAVAAQVGFRCARAAE